MKTCSKSMALSSAMVLLYIMAAVLSVGCGAEVYEDLTPGVTELQTDLSESTVSEGPAGESGPDDGTGCPEERDAEGGDALVHVFICGAVRQEGVYELPEGSRICDALEAAGGLTEEADTTWLNQAELVSDGQQLTALTKEEADGRRAGSGTDGLSAGPAGSSGSSGDGAARVNINTADAEALQSLSGIGASRAADIIAYRTEHGPFETIEDIMQVGGIKTALFNKIKNDITV